MNIAVLLPYKENYSRKLAEINLRTHETSQVKEKIKTSSISEASNSEKSEGNS